jgi:hypothetical protein
LRSTKVTKAATDAGPMPDQPSPSPGQTVQAELAFIRLMLEEPSADLTGNRAGNLKTRKQIVTLADADAQTPPPSLASHGFTAVPFSASPPGAKLDQDYRDYFAKTCAAAVKRETGAARVFGMPMNVRVRRSDGKVDQAPIGVSHSDFTPGSALRRATEILARQAPDRQLGRFAAFNAWWLVTDGPQDRPLALCDATSIAPADLQLGQTRTVGPDRAPRNYGEVAFQRYSPRQRWFWYPRLGPDRLLLFCGFDSNSSRPSMVTHCAFTNPDCPPGTAPRVSVECRCLAFW